ncbi:MAG: FkbM family methyltransferase [Candidatus Pacebacteria bacterium]|jgi:FkbM family methyltransferase|nr:FkbM family methyltransferase [Candidatus Paceibacterota bacterium]
MNQKIKQSLRHFVQKHYGYDLSAIRTKVGDDFLDQKKLLGNILTPMIFDVGANIGQTTYKYKKLFQKAEIYGFEPFPEVFEKYSELFKRDKHVHAEPIALSKENGTADFYSNNLHYTNSLLPNNPEYTDGNERYDPIATLRVKTETLDSYCEKHKIERIHILKMDVQGGELLVLQGSKKMLGNGSIDMIFTEVEFLEMYKRQPLMQDIASFLTPYGFNLHKIYNTASENGAPVAGDALFVRAKI